MCTPVWAEALVGSEACAAAAAAQHLQSWRAAVAASVTLHRALPCKAGMCTSGMDADSLQPQQAALLAGVAGCLNMHQQLAFICHQLHCADT